jgi:alginate export protein
VLQKISIAAGLAGLLLVSLSAAADKDAEADENSLVDAIISGTPHVKFRYRYEYVSDENFDKDANASNLKLRLNYATGKWRGWSAFGEFDYIGELFLNDFNSAAGTSPPDRNVYPVVADPKGADLNQFYLDYEGLADTRLRFGRQRILLDNERFVGPVGWRLNEQTFDAVSATYKGLAKTEIFYSFIGQVNRVFGERTPVGTQRMKSHILNVPITVADNWKVTPYYYYIRNDDSPAFALFSTATLGARAKGEIALGESTLKLVGEFATQSDIGDNPVSYSAQYFNLSAEWVMKSSLSLGVGLESLGGDENEPGKAFRTPLATLHAFQGWADLFLATAVSFPGAGVEDFTISAKYKIKKWKLQAIYHDFSAAAGSTPWGSEVDLAASRSLGDRYSLLLKGAVFSADNAAYRDVTKLWVQVIANF